MNWVLVALLSIPGLLMGLLSVRGHTRGIEPYLWIVLMVFAALVIARTAGAKYFLHGLSVGAAWGLLNGFTAAALFSSYAHHNPEIMVRLTSDGGSASYSPRVMFMLGAPMIGAAAGIVLGLLCWGASYVIPAVPLAGHAIVE
jgi:hypothetical protein